HKGHGQEQGADQGQLEGRQKRRSDVRGDHAGAFREEGAQRLRQEGIQVVGEVEQAEEDQQPDRHDAQQARTQFGQVSNQRHVAVVVLGGQLITHGRGAGSSVDGAPGAGSTASALGAAASAVGAAAVASGWVRLTLEVVDCFARSAMIFSLCRVWRSSSAPISRSTWLRTSAMRRLMRPTYRQTVRTAPGSLSGPSTSRATTATTTISRKPISNMDHQSLCDVDSVFFSACTSRVSPLRCSTEGLSSSFIDLRKPLMASPTSEPMPFSRLVPNSRITISRMIASCQILIPPKPIFTSGASPYLVTRAAFSARPDKSKRLSSSFRTSSGPRPR